TFTFSDSFNEMIDDFRKHNPELVSNGKKVSADWTIYYLRDKALTRPVTKEELAWIILNFNAKRGYYQIRGEEEESIDKDEEYKVLEVISVEKTGPNLKRKGYNWYTVTYQNGEIQPCTSPFTPHKVGDKVELIVTTSLDKEGKVRKDKEGNPVIRVRSPKEDDWTLKKKRTEHEIEVSKCTVGSYIYHNILNNPDVKVRGNLVHTIERKLYKEELRIILDRQKQFIPELNDCNLYMNCVHELYKNNESHVESIKDGNFTDFFIDDIIFYQRPLKSKKSLISDCPYEKYHYIDKETGEIISKPIKCISKSHPLFQEFRLWQFIKNLHIYIRSVERDGKLKTDDDITSQLLSSTEDYIKLFDWLNNKNEIKQDQILKYKPFSIGKDITNYRWNYVEDRAYPCNKTMYDINKCLSKVDPSIVLTSQQEIKLWHILYSVEDPIELQKALASFARNNGISVQSFVNEFKKMKPFERDYGSYSEKAIKKLLPLMRKGKYWNVDNIDANTQKRINNIINGVEDDTISSRVREKFSCLTNIEQYCGLELWQACYIVYNRHSEAEDTTVWNEPEDIDYYLRTVFKQNSLRNPVVESVLCETLRVVRDLWKTYGKIDEVHVEMGRDLKQDSRSRLKDTQRMLESERTNLRIKILLQELASSDCKVDNVRPYSPNQQEILKIYEEHALSNYSNDLDDDMRDIIKNLGNISSYNKISHSDILRYRLWLEQKYQSPYTGQTIPLSKLFTPAYEIEHIIPQSRYFDDSITNKVICEKEVNKLKDRMLGYEFIISEHGRMLKDSRGKSITIFDRLQYEDFVRQHYSSNRIKMKKLLMDDIPDGFIQRQLNDSRYMSRKVIDILSRLVRKEGEEESVAKNIISTNGRITDRLKKDWGLNDVWNHIIYPRFERMNDITKSNSFGEWVNKNGKKHFQINIPLELPAGFSKKRIDHRHHAMDAIVIACSTRNIINYLNNQSALSGESVNRKDLQNLLCSKVYSDSNSNYVWQINKPWGTFTQDVESTLRGIIVSFKQNLRVVNKTNNYYQHYVDGKKIFEKQIKGDRWAIRKSLHKASVSGLVSLQCTKIVKLGDALKDWHSIKDKSLRKEIKRLIGEYKGYDVKTILKYFKDRGYKLYNNDISKVEIYYYTSGKDALSAHRVPIDSTFDEKTIKAISDSGIQKILLNHLHRYDDVSGKSNPDVAFSPEGISVMNNNIEDLNGGKLHKPITHVRKTETLGMKFAVGENGNKTKKLVEADKGTNLYYAIYVDENGKRSYETIPINIAIERLKNGLSVANSIKEDGRKLLFTLSPFDLVYLPEDVSSPIGNITDASRIFKMVSCTTDRSFFIPDVVASAIQDGVEYQKMNKIELFDGISIRSFCIKIEVNRLGGVTKIYQ
ncbi:MAG TPA: HNH endonuclease domain-containing protein, partial [Xylanibacter oryzae]|nr:HNH endonuclease domain-containing protein [Xylanibacter oryzae]